MTKYVNLAIDDELFNKIEKQRGNIALDRFIVNKLKERIEECETRDYSPKFLQMNLTRIRKIINDIHQVTLVCI
jgi:hypothetical protein